MHYAVYRFADRAACDRALGLPEFQDMIADFNRAFPEGVTRTRDVVTLVEEREGLSPSCAGLTRASMMICREAMTASPQFLNGLMDCRVKPGNDGGEVFAR